MRSKPLQRNVCVLPQVDSEQQPGNVRSFQVIQIPVSGATQRNIKPCNMLRRAALPSMDQKQSSHGSIKHFGDPFTSLKYEAAAPQRRWLTQAITAYAVLL